MHDIWNPWHGCRKFSPGCARCYMYALDEMRGVAEWSEDIRRTKSFDYPLKKDRRGNYKISSGERIRVNMTSDTFLKEADEWRGEFWDIIRKRPDVIFWLLTKRVERISECLPEDWGEGWENVVLNITCENQEMFVKRWQIFKDIPAKHKGLCLAPLLAAIDISPALSSGQIEEVSCGGENYNDPRMCDENWVKSLSKQCEAYKVNFVWYETGTYLLKDGIIWNLPTKKMQAEAAYMSGYSHVYGEVKYRLFSPIDGHELVSGELYQKKYNLHRCKLCANQLLCNGCSNCGNCDTVELVEKL